MTLLFGRLRQILGWYHQEIDGQLPATPGSWRVVISEYGSLPTSPMTVEGCSVTDPGRLVALSLAALDAAAIDLNEGTVSVFTDSEVIAVHRARLRQLGVAVDVVAVQ